MTALVSVNAGWPPTGAVFLFQVHVGSPFVVYSQSPFCERVCCRFRNIQRGHSNRCASFDSISGIFETTRIIPNVAARLPADVTRSVAQLSAPDEMSALIQPSYLHHDSYYCTCNAKASARWRPVRLLAASSESADGANLEPASFVVIENCPEDAGRVEVRVTIPVDRTVHAHQCNGAHVTYDSVVFDRLIRHRVPRNDL
jgi:hypothetical protein